MTEFILPATIPESFQQQSQKLGLDVHSAIGCNGYSRVDMIVHPEKGPFVLEVNTLPGLTDLSDLPQQAKSYGISFDYLIETILASALKK